MSTLSVETAKPAAYWVPIASLHPWLKNPRKRDLRHIDRVAKSIQRWGFVAPAVVWTSAKRLVAGHTRIMALASILKDNPKFVPREAPGPGVVPVRFHEFDSEREANLYAVADNRFNELGEWNNPLLADFLGPMMLEWGDKAEVAGFSDDDILKLLKTNADEILEETAAADDSAKVQTGYVVLVDCEDESQQLELIGRFQSEGLRCRALV